MIKRIIKKLDLEENIKLISPIDEIKLDLNMIEFYDIIKNYKTTDESEKYIKTLLSKKESIKMDILSDNYHSNTLQSIYFVISNPYSIDTSIFNIIYKNRSLIKKIPDNIIKKYEYIIKSDLHKFYNYDIIVKWDKTIMCKKINKNTYYKFSKLSTKKKDKKWMQYELVWIEFDNACIQLKNYIQRLLKFYKPLEIPIVGCSYLGKNYYEFCLESYVGLKLDIKIIYEWAKKELLNLIEEMKVYIKIVTDIKNDDNFKYLLNKIYNDESQKFKSKNELIKLYKNKIEKYETIFIKKLNFPQYEKVNLIIFDNKYLSGGYYYLNNFYLNTYNWKDMRKYTVESLVLHETIPGHHTQVHVSSYNQKQLLFSYLWSSCTGFIEGWGLFSEKLGYDQTVWDKIGQTEFEIFRTLRVIVDIDLHYYGKSPNEMIKFMKNYLTMSDNEITSEVYRYVCDPGQAVAYKIGEHVFKKILEKNKICNLLDPKALELYKKIILDGPKPLKFICKDYNIDNLFR